MTRRALPRIKTAWLIGFAAVCLLRPLDLSQAQSESIDLTASRHYYLDQLVNLPTYSPGKNSFLIQNLNPGDKRTVLDLTGSGSVRHIWSTWSAPGDDSGIPAPGRIVMRIWVDGQSEAAIAGPLDDLCRAAERTADRFVPLPAFNYKGAFNFYLPIFFRRGIRIEIEATDDIAEFYTQIDYRSGENQQSSARLVSGKSSAGVNLKYLGGSISWHGEGSKDGRTARRIAVLDYGPTDAGELEIGGPATLRELSFRSESVADLQLEIYWDGERTPGVQAPLRYFFADFINAAMESRGDRSTTFFPMPFRTKARLVIHSLSGRSGHVTIEYALDRGPITSRTLYFHALYRESSGATGYAQYSVLQAEGEGLFVGMNLFDSGHNHGGGDAALIDAGTASPRVLHGICGEDYFGFAWHQTGTMTPLTGAPVHERRYRLHLGNPYPFHESLQFLFGVFAGQHPKSVAFWYQLSGSTPQSNWRTFDIPWKILGPAGVGASLPDAVTDASYATIIPIDQPTSVEERWQDAEMRSGFFDATYQFRHYAMVEKGTGFVAGAGKTIMITHVYAPSRRHVDVLIGHDDRVILVVNGSRPDELSSQKGFAPSRIKLRLRRGWNRLELTVYNDENLNWRWCGVSLAFHRNHSADLKFASQAHPASR